MKHGGTVVLVHGTKSGLEGLKKEIREKREDLKVVVALQNERIALW
jgi:hypothetical protein